MWNRYFFKLKFPFLCFSLFTLMPRWIHIFTPWLWRICRLPPRCIAAITVFLSLFSSGLMVLLLSRSKPRMAQPPASQVCYETPPVWLDYDGNWCIITSSRLKPNSLLSDHCSWDSRGLFAFPQRSQIVFYHIFNCCKTISSVAHVFHALWWHGCLWDLRAGLNYNIIWVK